MFKVIITIVLTIASLLSLPASQPASASSNEPLTFNAYPLMSSSLWASEVLSDAGVSLPANVRLAFTNEGNCGAEISIAGLGGCTTYHEDMSMTVTISRELSYSSWGNHILMHEIAHTLGADECTAEAYAHQFEQVALWSYPECEVA
jgi:hypothetical protein